MESGRGDLVRRVFDLRNAIKAGLHVGLDDVTVEEFRTLHILESEICRPTSTDSNHSN